jgi:hypothetical protein
MEAIMDKQPIAILSEIAKDELNIETLETRNRDYLDFHDISVWRIKCALKAAFDAGHNFNH